MMNKYLELVRETYNVLTLLQVELRRKQFEMVSDCSGSSQSKEK